MALELEMETYNRNSDEFTKQHSAEWVVISGDRILGFYKRFETAALAALQAFGPMPFLIRQIDAPPATLPYLIVEP